MACEVKLNVFNYYSYIANILIVVCFRKFSETVSSETVRKKYFCQSLNFIVLIWFTVCIYLYNNLVNKSFVEIF